MKPRKTSPPYPTPPSHFTDVRSFFTRLTGVVMYRCAYIRKIGKRTPNPSTQHTQTIAQKNTTV